MKERTIEYLRGLNRSKIASCDLDVVAVICAIAPVVVIEPKLGLL